MTPSEQAKLAQFKDDNYPGIDNWQDSNLHQGNIVFIWEADGQNGHFEGNAYAMTPKTALGCNGDPNQLQDALQTNINPDYSSHRGHLQAYRIKEDTPAAFSHCEANKCHGSGGGEQYYIPGFDDRLHDGRIEKADDLNLNFHKDTLPINDSQVVADQRNTLMQPPESSPSPSPDTTPTLDGAYEGPTPNKAAELKPQIDAAQQQWNANVSNNQTSGEPPPQTPPTATPETPGISGEPPQHKQSVPGEDNQISGTLPGQAQGIDLPGKEGDGTAGKDLAESATKKNHNGFDPNTGIT